MLTLAELRLSIRFTFFRWSEQQRTHSLNQQSWSVFSELGLQCAGKAVFFARYFMRLDGSRLFILGANSDRTSIWKLLRLTASLSAFSFAFRPFSSPCPSSSIYCRVRTPADAATERLSCLLSPPTSTTDNRRAVTRSPELEMDGGKERKAELRPPSGVEKKNNRSATPAI